LLDLHLSLEHLRLVLAEIQAEAATILALVLPLLGEPLPQVAPRRQSDSRLYFT
jgi:hypothetical protein